MTQGPIRWGGPLPGNYFPGEFWGGPVPSKDGSRIFALGLSPRGELSRFDSKTKQFQPFLGGISCQGVSYSKDGKSIAYVSYPEGILWKANRDGSNPVQLTDPPLQAFMPRWSPDGKQISFAGDYPGPNGAFYLVSSDGGSPRKFLAQDQHLDGAGPHRRALAAPRHRKRGYLRPHSGSEMTQRCASRLEMHFLRDTKR